ncbi:MAG TPA: LexA family transcriptional regulator [Erysipelotrichaceae bacterium]|nr:LexA family transcriptional regulator [Erysipelotrichaceae bacterium]
MDSIFVERLHQALKMKRFKQSDLSEKSGIGKSFISQYMSGKVMPKSDKISRIAIALGVKETWLLGYENDYHRDMMPIPSTNGIKIPVLGKVVAGLPIEAVQDIIDYEEISPELAKTGDFFALQIRGDSMQPVIIDGDIAIVKKQADVDSGQIGIVLINGHDATVKRVVKRESGIMLIPFNNNYEPLVFNHEEIISIPVEIVGRVIEIRRKF